MTAFLSIALPINRDSDTKTSRFLAITIASSIVEAYCKISRVSIDTGVLATKGTLDLPALMVTVNPCSFIPETTPTIPPQVTDINLCPASGLTNAIILSFAKSSPA